MRKHLILLISLATTVLTANAQGKNVKIGYIDMEYILENVPDYNEANIQLEQKAQRWKGEMEAKKAEINKLKESLKTEQVLLTKELIEERQEEIAFLENELNEFQQKKFGPTGELVVQKAVLVKPIQDQIFTAVQDLAEARRYDFIFDKSSDLTMLFAAKRYDISDYIIRTLERAAKRSSMTKKQIKEAQAKEYQEDLEDLNPELAAKQKAKEDSREARAKLLEERKAAREKLLEERKAAAEAKKREAEAKRQKAVEEKNTPKTEEPAPAKTSPETDKKTDGEKGPQSSAEKTTSAKAETTAATETESTSAEDKEAAKKAAAEAKKKAIEEQKKAIEERKAKVLAEREAARKAKEEEQKAKTTN